MKNTLKKKWNNLSESDIKLFMLINEIILANHCSYFLIGAKARDILLEFYDKNEALRATSDTDIAICCKNWEDFYKIKDAFIKNSDFIADKSQEHRLISRTKF